MQINVLADLKSKMCKTGGQAGTTKNDNAMLIDDFKFIDSRSGFKSISIDSNIDAIRAPESSSGDSSSDGSLNSSDKSFKRRCYRYFVDKNLVRKIK